MEGSHSACYRLLIEALQLVACEATVQIESLPSFVHVPDEIALTFDHPYRCISDPLEEGVITAQQKEQLNSLDYLFERMTEDKSLWTLAALQSAPEWDQTRVVAREVLKLMGQSLRKPDWSGMK